MQTYGLLQEDMQTAVMAEVRKRKTMKQAWAYVILRKKNKNKKIQ